MALLRLLRPNHLEETHGRLVQLNCGAEMKDARRRRLVLPLKLLWRHRHRRHRLVVNRLDFCPSIISLPLLVVPRMVIQGRPQPLQVRLRTVRYRKLRASALHVNLISSTLVHLEEMEEMVPMDMETVEEEAVVVVVDQELVRSWD